LLIGDVYMGRNSYALAFGVYLLVTGGVCPAQQPTGPRTLESLLTEPEPDVGSDASQAKPEEAAPTPAPRRLQGTLLRPTAGHQHPDLNKTWADYEATIKDAEGPVRDALAKLFDAAADKGDLDTAEKWQQALDAFDKSGELPTDKDAKAAVTNFQREMKTARDNLGKSYQALVKTLTSEKAIKDAKAVRDEWKSVEADGDTEEGASVASAGAKDGRQSPKSKQPGGGKVLPVTYRFNDEKEIRKDWDFTTENWQIVNGMIRLHRDCRLKSRKTYDGDLRVRIATVGGWAGVRLCGLEFTHPGPITAERRGNLLTIWVGAEQRQSQQVTLKESQMGKTDIVLNGDRWNEPGGGIAGVEILGTLAE